MKTMTILLACSNMRTLFNHRNISLVQGIYLFFSERELIDERSFLNENRTPLIIQKKLKILLYTNRLVKLGIYKVKEGQMTRRLQFIK